MAKVIFPSKAILHKKKFAKDEFSETPLPDFGSLFGGLLKSWDDPTYSLNAEAYKSLRRNDVVVQPMQKLAERIGSMSLTVVGRGKQRDELQRIVDQTIALGDALAWLAWAHVDGERFLWNRAAFDRETDIWIPDFRGCGRMKWKAGGTWYFSGWEDNQVGKLEEYQPTNDDKDKASSEAKWMPRERCVVYRPGAGNNPEGEPDTTLQLYLITEMAQLLDKYMRVYAERYALPREMLKAQIEAMRPDEVTSKLRSAAAKMKLANARQRMSMSAMDAIELLEPRGNTWEFLTSFRSLLESRVHRLITGEDLSSGSDGSTGDRGGHESSEKQLNSIAVARGKKIADALTTDWLPFVMRTNRHLLPKRKKDEPKPYLALRPPVEKQRPTIPELVQILDREIPVNTDFIYEVIGTDRPEGQPDVFVPKPKVNPMQMQQGGGDIPSNKGGDIQRGDREQKDSGIGKDDMRKQKKEEDLRNVKKESSE